MKQPKISIIVAVYQAEKYLNRCLDSIQSQTIKDFEAILVDDGSLDNSGAICDCYAKKDSRFHVIHKKNEGVSIARQTGLDAAQGEYVIHADPDDWVEPDWIESLFHKIEEEEADMVICDFDRIFSDKVIKYIQRPTSLANNDILADLINEKIWGSCCNKLIRRNCFEYHKISFHPEMNLWEDLYVTCLLVIKGIKVEYVPRILYHYDSTINENSIVMHRNDSHIRSCMIFIDDFSPILSSEDYDDGWFHLKYKIKKWIFLVKNSNYDIVKTYSEINEKCIKKTKFYRIWSLDTCVALCLKGHSRLAHFLYSMFNQALLLFKR